MEAAPTPGVNVTAANLENALRLASHGIPVFPCKPDKSPYTPNGFYNAATDELSIQRWWRQYPDALPGISCAAAGLIVIDADMRAAVEPRPAKEGKSAVKAKAAVNGMLALRILAETNGISLVQSPCVTTPSGGGHCYYRLPPGMEATNAEGTLPDGLNVRGKGHVIAPGAMLPNGKRYIPFSGSPDLAATFKAGTIPILPNAFAAHITARKPVEPQLPIQGRLQATPGSPPGPDAPPPLPREPPAVPPPFSAATARETAYARAALDGKARDLAALGKGGRNKALNDHAYVMARMAAAGWIDRATVEPALVAAVVSNGLVADDGQDSAAATFVSGWNGGMQAGAHNPLPAELPILPSVAALVAGMQAGAGTAHLAGRNGQQQAGAVPALAALPPPVLWTSFDYELIAHTAYVIKGLLAPGNVGMFLGHPNAGKSTLATHLAYAVAQGLPFFGMRTRKGRTLYLAAEDAAGAKKRLYALGLKHGHTADCAVLECGNLRNVTARATVAAALTTFKPSLVILDTLGAAFAGLDENSSADMGMVVAWLRAVAATGAAVLAVHHPAKQADGGNATARGHGSLNGTLDMSLVLTPDDVMDVDALVRGTLAKNRNDSTARTLAFRKDVIVLGRDDEGDSITTTLPVEASDITMSPEIDTSTISDVQEIMDGGNYRRDWQAANWVGNVIGGVLGYKTPILKGDRKEVEAKLAKLVKGGWIEEYTELDGSRKPRRFVRTGIRAQIPSQITVGGSPLGLGVVAPLLHPAPPLLHQ